MNLIILLKLLSAHIIADFFLQFDWLCQGKQEKGIRGLKAQTIHALIHAVCAYLLLANWVGWLIPLVIFITHFIIDIVKVKWFSKSTIAFLIDQAAHIAVIVGLWWMMYADNATLQTWLCSQILTQRFWILFIGYMLIFKPASLLIGMFIKGWAPSNSMQLQGMPNAGKWIGYIERVLVLTFVITGNIEAVGFLLAAKSIFRFGDLNKAREIKITEYVLLGTLASFSIALLIGFTINLLIH
ncbi:MAG: DUF3307 domain-containing protein [Muribaculaceae bacterium]|nr:DUF3307 domain-containing protein [Muribaculaceae bacterium]